MKKMTVVLVVLLLTTFAVGEKKLLHVDRNDLAVQGYDPVAFFTDKKPVRGNPQFQSSYNGAIYYFATPENKSKFDASPAKYEPQFGGFCAYAASQGYTATVDVNEFQILNDRLLLQYSSKAREKFNKDPQESLKKADQNWPGIVERNGK